MKSIVAAILIPLTPACIWIDGTTIDGGHVSVSGRGPAKQLRRSIESTSGEMLLRYSLTDRYFDDEEDTELLAVAELLEGKTGKAIASLTELEKKTPGSYSVAANLGTAYELHGDNHNALKWITEGIKRNADAHHGTEWLHLLILETKIKLENDSSYLDQRQVIELPEEFDKNTIIQVGGDFRDIKEIGNAIFYQLQERLVFVKDADPVVASLLFSYARIVARVNTVEGALKVLEISKDYGFPDTASMEALEKKYQRLIFIRRLKKYGLIALGIVLFILALRWMHHKKWFFLSRKGYDTHLTQTG